MVPAPAAVAVAASLARAARPAASMSVTTALAVGELGSIELKGMRVGFKRDASAACVNGAGPPVSHWLILGSFSAHGIICFCFAATRPRSATAAAAATGARRATRRSEYRGHDGAMQPRHK